jgi:uncharacterized protein
LKTKWLAQKEKYDGSQLQSLFAYLEHEIMGDSCVAWRGSCDVSLEHMVDGEDLLEEAKICGSDMIHFIMEIFDRELMSGVLLQRLMASIVKDVLQELAPKFHLVRIGDDLYLGQKKLSISIATKSPTSTLVHFAVNVSTKGTPVPTVGLSDLKVDVKKFAHLCLTRLELEYVSSLNATRKVRWVP